MRLFASTFALFVGIIRNAQIKRIQNIFILRAIKIESNNRNQKLYIHTCIHLVLAIFCVKIMGELFFMWEGTRLFNYKHLRRHLIWTSPIQLIIVLYAVLGGVLGGFLWKSDKFTRKLE